MPEITTLLAFALASLALTVIPGPSVLYITSRGVSQGPMAGLTSAAGVQLGALVHVVAATVGLSALITASALAFGAIKVAGGIYLIVLGVMALRRRHDTAAVEVSYRSTRQLLVDGFVVNALNPKTAVFFMAFLPQFVRPGSGSPTAQVLVLGCTFVAVALCSDSVYAVLSGWAGESWRRRRGGKSPRRSGTVIGAVYIGLGVVSIGSLRHR